MKRTLTLLAIGFWLTAPVITFAAKTTYIFTDRRFHFVKREELKSKELKARGEANHPYTFSDLQMHNLLANIRLNKKYILAKKTEELTVFDPVHLDWMIPYVVKAFQDAKPNEEVVFAMVTPAGKFLIRDDRLTIVRGWVEKERLHLYFKKLMAKVPNNFDKLSDVSQAMNRSQSINVTLDLQKGQEFGKSMDELVLAIPSTESLSLAASETAAPETTAPKKGSASKKKSAPEAAAAAPAENASVETRLQQLQKLKDQGLISSKEYETKKKEILKEL